VADEFRNWGIDDGLGLGEGRCLNSQSVTLDREGGM
jgi:hypothetical protein